MRFAPNAGKHAVTLVLFLKFNFSQADMVIERQEQAVFLVGATRFTGKSNHEF
jgi:hypothetical protein